MSRRSQESENGHRSRRRFLRVGLQVVALGTAAFFFFRERHVFEGFLSHIGRLRWPWVAAAEVFRHPALLTRAVQWLERHVGRRLGAVVASASRRVRDIAEGLTDLDPSLVTWSAVAGMSALNWLLDTA